MKRLWHRLFPPPVDLMAAQMAEVANRPNLPKTPGGFEWMQIDAEAITANKIAAGSITTEKITIP